MGSKKTQRGSVRGGRRLASTRKHFCLGLHARATLMNPWGRLVPASFYVQSLTLGKWPRSLLAMRFQTMLITVNSSPVKDLVPFLKVLHDGIWPILFLLIAIIEHQGGYVTCTAGLAISDYLILDSWNYFYFLTLKCPRQTNLPSYNHCGPTPV